MPIAGRHASLSGPPKKLSDSRPYGAGIQVHVEDLATHVAGHERGDGQARWNDLMPAYQDLAADFS
jgi:hypothetical protein